jgi:hypothetical protein
MHVTAKLKTFGHSNIGQHSQNLTLKHSVEQYSVFLLTGLLTSGYGGFKSDGEGLTCCEYCS